MTDAERNAKWPYRLRYTTGYGESGSCHATEAEALKAARKVVNGFLRGKRHTAGQPAISLMVFRVAGPAFGFDVIARYRVSRDCGWT